MPALIMLGKPPPNPPLVIFNKKVLQYTFTVLRTFYKIKLSTQRKMDV